MDTKLEHYLKACVPLIYIRTSEDSRAVKHIMKAMATADLTDCWTGEWSANRGLAVDGSSEKGVDTISKALSFLITSETPGVLVLYNIRQFISNFLVIQDLKDAAMICRTVGSYIILVGVETEFPPELKDLVTLYDYPLPGKAFFISAFSEIVSRYKEGIELPILEKDKEVLLSKASEAALGMTAIQGENALALSIVKTKSIDIPTIYAEKEQAIKQSDVLELTRTEESLDTLGGFDMFKSWINKRVACFSRGAKKYGLRPSKGILIAGVPGTGKSLCVKGIASAFSIPLIRFDIGKVFRSLQGQSEGAVRQALSVAEAVAPCVLWIDEMEKSMAGAESSGITDSGTAARVMQTILTWLQEKDSPVYVVATVNRIESIPPELLRKGRFDEIFGVDMPVLSERGEIFSIHLKKRKRSVKHYDLGGLAAATEGFVGAEIEAVIDDAMITAFSEGVREFTTDDILNAIRETIPQSESQSEKIEKIREWITTRTRPVSKQNVFMAGVSATIETKRKVRAM